MASIRKLTNGSWEATVYLGRDAGGKILRESFTRSTRKEAADAARIKEQEVKDGDVTKYSKMTLKAFQAVWLDLYCPSLSSSTAKAYRMYERVHITPAMGQITLNKLNTFHLQQYFIEKAKTGISPNTLRRHYFYLSRVLKSALKYKSPLQDVKAPTPADFDPVLLPPAAYTIMRGMLRGTGLELPFLLASNCGLRAGEICALKWDDISLVNTPPVMYVRVDEALVIKEDASQYSTKGPKSRRGLRNIIAPAAVMQCVMSTPQGAQDDRLITIRPDSLGKKWSRWIKKTNAALPEEDRLPVIRFHDLRHYHATQLWREGFSDKYAAARLGHDEHVLRAKYQHMDKTYINEADMAVLAAFAEAAPSEQKTEQNHNSPDA